MRPPVLFFVPSVPFSRCARPHLVRSPLPAHDGRARTPAFTAMTRASIDRRSPPHPLNYPVVPQVFHDPGTGLRQALPAYCARLVRSLLAAALSAIALCLPMSAAHANQRSQSPAQPEPGAGIVVFDKDFAATWDDGMSLSFRLSPPSAPSTDPQPPSSPPIPAPATSPVQAPELTPRYVKGRGTGLPTPSLSLEAQVLSRLLVALVVGGVIGMERRAANSLAGVRTFSLVSLGAAVFMSTTLIAFPAADPNRIAAAISSSVGFLGAGAMHKNAKHSRGLTTATSVWLAAALGIAAAAGLFLLSFSGAVATALIARYARFNSSLHLIRGDPASGTLTIAADELHDDQDEINEFRANKGQVQAQAQGQAQRIQSSSTSVGDLPRNGHGGNGRSGPGEDNHIAGEQQDHRWTYRKRGNDNSSETE